MLIFTHDPENIQCKQRQVTVMRAVMITDSLCGNTVYQGLLKHLNTRFIWLKLQKTEDLVFC